MSTTELILLYIAVAELLAVAGLAWAFFGKRKQTLARKPHAETGALPPPAAATPRDVAEFYDQHTDKFLEVYGEIIQAFRTNRVTDYLDYTMRNAELKDGQRIIDAGCGVGGPAIHFARQLEVHIEGVTISPVQARQAKEKVKANNLADKIHITCADYHDINKIFEPGSFDRVLFLESFGHSDDKDRLIGSAWQVLQPGGILYIKDLFERAHPNPEDGARISRIVRDINDNYRYNIADLNRVLTRIRQIGFILQFVKTPEVEIDQFEHLSISLKFQELFGIGHIESWEDYVFPVDFYEIKCRKPDFNPEQSKELFFMNR